jgi:uncharacterized protein
MKIFMTGGTGFLGIALAQSFIEQGYAVTILSRSAGKNDRLPPRVSVIAADPTKKGAWQQEAAAHDVIVNLAGASIFHRWSKEYKEVMRRSRIDTTRNLVESLAAPGRTTKLLLSASAVGYYGSRGDEELDEASQPGNDFLAGLCREWEAAAAEAEQYSIRVVRCRFGIVLGEGGGAFDKMLPAFKLGLGSPLGSGRQWFSWIHRQDLIRIFLFLLKNAELTGPVNCTAPNPVPNREMTELLGKALHRPVFMPRIPSFLLKSALGDLGAVVLESQRVLPRKLEAAGFLFEYPEIRKAFADLVAARNS